MLQKTASYDRERMMIIAGTWNTATKMSLQLIVKKKSGTKWDNCTPSKKRMKNTWMRACEEKIIGLVISSCNNNNNLNAIAMCHLKKDIELARNQPINHHCNNSYYFLVFTLCYSQTKWFSLVSRYLYLWFGGLVLLFFFFRLFVDPGTGTRFPFTNSFREP